MPVLLGLPWLAAVLGSLFTGVVAWLAQYVTKRIAILVAAIAALTTLTVAFVAIVQGAIDVLSFSFPIAANFGFILPPDLSALVGSYAAIRLAHWVYSWNIKIVQLRLF
jgi:hypothetical protein